MAVRVGLGTGRRFSAFVAGEAPATPDAPTDLTVESNNFFSIVFSFTPGATNGATVIDYRVQYRVFDAEAGPNDNWITFVRAASTATTVEITGLLPSNYYDIRVRAITAGGASPWSTTFSETFTAYSHMDVVSPTILAFYKFPSADRDRDDGPNLNNYDFFTFPDAPAYEAGKVLHGTARVRARFDPTSGSGSRIDFNYSALGNIAATPPFFVAFWLTIGAPSSDSKVIMDASGGDPNGWDITIVDGLTDPKVQFRMNVDDIDVTVTSDPITINTPTLVIAVYDPSDAGLMLIVDNNIVSTLASGTPLANTGIRIGANVDDTAAFTIQELLFVAGIDMAADFDVFRQFLWNDGNGVALESHFVAPSP